MWSVQFKTKQNMYNVYKETIMKSSHFNQYPRAAKVAALAAAAGVALAGAGCTPEHDSSPTAETGISPTVLEKDYSRVTFDPDKALIGVSNIEKYVGSDNRREQLDTAMYNLGLATDGLLVKFINKKTNHRPGDVDFVLAPTYVDKYGNKHEKTATKPGKAKGYFLLTEEIPATFNGNPASEYPAFERVTIAAPGKRAVTFETDEHFSDYSVIVTEPNGAHSWGDAGQRVGSRQDNKIGKGVEWVNDPVKAAELESWAIDYAWQALDNFAKANGLNK